MSDRSKQGVSAERTGRRQVIVGAAVAFSGLTMRPIGAWGSAEDGISHSAESIHQEPVFKVSRKRVYEALIDAKQFDKVARMSAAMQSGMALGNKSTEISREVGGAFTLFGGHIVGRHIEIVPNERIVQAWRVVDWDPGVYSIVKFELMEQGSGTKLVLDHTGFPEGKGQHLADGWKANYWQPLEKYLG
jgi:activator of HSP90 ATPase